MIPLSENRIGNFCKYIVWYADFLLLSESSFKLLLYTVWFAIKAAEELIKLKM